MEEIDKHATLIIIGETGSGKTTQIPQFVHDIQLEKNKTIGITQVSTIYYSSNLVSNKVVQIKVGPQYIFRVFFSKCNPGFGFKVHIQILYLTEIF